MIKHCVAVSRRKDQVIVSLYRIGKNSAQREYQTKIELPSVADWRSECAARAVEEWRIINSGAADRYEMAEVLDAPAFGFRQRAVAAAGIVLILLVGVVAIAGFSSTRDGRKEAAAEVSKSRDKAVASFDAMTSAERVRWLQESRSFSSVLGREHIYTWAKSISTDAGLCKASWTLQLHHETVETMRRNGLIAAGEETPTSPDAVAAQEYLKDFSMEAIEAAIDRDAPRIGTDPEAVKRGLWRLIHE